MASETCVPFQPKPPGLPLVYRELDMYLTREPRQCGLQEEHGVRVKQMR